MAETRKRGFGGLKTGNDRPKRLEDSVEMLTLPKDGTWVTGRILGDVHSIAQRWIDIVTAKGVISIPKVALNYDSETDDFDSTVEDPYADISNPQRLAVTHYVNFLVRDLQDTEPKKNKPTDAEKKTGFKDKNSKSWTPVRGLRVPKGLAGKLGSLIALNKHKTKKGTEAFELSDPAYGCDVHIAYDESKSPSEKYAVQKAEHSPLTKAEKKFLTWDLARFLTQPESFEIAEKEAANLEAKAPLDEEGGDEGGDDFKVKDKKSKKGKSKGKSDDKPKKDKKSKYDIDDDFDKPKKGKKEKSGKADKSDKKEKSGKSDKKKDKPVGKAGKSKDKKKKK